MRSSIKRFSVADKFITFSRAHGQVGKTKGISMLLKTLPESVSFPFFYLKFLAVSNTESTDDLASPRFFYFICRLAFSI